jgi:hypothetical protein
VILKVKVKEKTKQASSRSSKEGRHKLNSLKQSLVLQNVIPFMQKSTFYN